MILRLARVWTTNQFSSKEAVSKHLRAFLGYYIKPIVDKSSIFTSRKTIRKNARLNELLFDNQSHLLEFFSKAKLPVVGFTK